MAYNPASLRVREKTSGKDLRGIVTLILPDGTVTELGQGAVLLNIAGSSGFGATTPFDVTQDSVNPRLFTITGTDTWIAASIRVYWNGAQQKPSLVTVSGAGNRTITLDPTVPMPLGSTDYGLVWGEGIKS